MTDLHQRQNLAGYPTIEHVASRNETYIPTTRENSIRRFGKSKFFVENVEIYWYIWYILYGIFVI